jgi:hypothetical protein
VKRIPLHDRAGVVAAYALVDDDVFAKFGDITWSLSANGYVQNRSRNVRLHRLVMGLLNGEPDQVDHRNGDRLDNRRVNLRIVTREAQSQNRPSNAGSNSRYRGVTPRDGRFLARVKSNGRAYNLGTFDTELEAAAAASAGRRLLLPYSQEGSESQKQGTAARTTVPREAATG